MADMTLACDSVVVVNPPIPNFIISQPLPSIIEVAVPSQVVEVRNPPELRVITPPPTDPTIIVLPVGGPPGRQGEQGETGQPGASGELLSDQDVQESPDGVLEIFTSVTPFIPSTLMVFLNGLLESHIVRLSTTSFQFTTPPEPGDVIKLTFSPA